MQLTREPRAGGAARAIAPVTVAGEPIGALAVLAEPPAVHAPSATLRALQAHEKLVRVVTGARSWLRSEQSTQQDSAPPSALPAEVAARSRLAQLFQSAPVLPFVERPTAAELGGIWMRMHLDQLTGDDLKRVMGSIRATNAAYAEAPCNGGRSMREAMLAHFGLALSVQPTATFLDGAAEMLEHSVAPWEPEITQAMAFRGDLNAVRVVPRALIPSGQAIEAAFAAFERTDAPTGAEISAALGVQPSGPLANLAAALVPLADRHFLHEHELIDVLAPTFTVPPFDPNANPAEPIRRAITAAVGRAARAKTPARFVVGELDGAPVELGRRREEQRDLVRFVGRERRHRVR